METPAVTPAGHFTATAAGLAGGPLVLLLHGYPQTRHTWHHQVPALGAAGYRAVAPDQRGYSPGVRPDPAKGLDAYAIDRLVQDVLDMADAIAAVAEYLSVLGEPAALEAALARYRAAGTLTAAEVGSVTVPTLYIWGDADATVGPSAVRFTADFVSGPFRFEVPPGVGHFVTDQAPEAVTRGLLSHLARHR